MNKAADSLAESLKKYELESGEMRPIMVINPYQGKLMMDIIVMKEVDEKMVYSRQLESREITVDYLLKTLTGVEI